jgi:hypothetical protein
MVRCFLSGHCDAPQPKEAGRAISDTGPAQRWRAEASCCTIRHEAKANEGEAGLPQGMIWPIMHSVIATPGPQCSCA